MGTTKNTFKKGLAELVKKGLVRVHRRTTTLPGKKRQSLPNVYEIADIRPLGKAE